MDILFNVMRVHIKNELGPACTYFYCIIIDYCTQQVIILSLLFISDIKHNFYI